MKDNGKTLSAETNLCEHLSDLLIRGREMLHAGKVDGYYQLLPEIDEVITELALRVKRWRKARKQAFGLSWKRDLLEKFKGLQKAACESERLAQHSVEVTFNGLMQLSQALTPKPTYTSKANTTTPNRALVFDQQA